MRKLCGWLAALLWLLAFPALAAENKPTSSELAARWAATRYPDDVGGVYCGGDSRYITVGLVGADEARREEIRNMVSDPANLTFDEFAYSCNDMLAACRAISEELSEEEGLYAVGVGWSSEKGSGFGPSGKDFRVFVDAEKSRCEQYARRYEERYGGMVVVRESTGASFTDMTWKNGAPVWRRTSMGVWLALAVAAMGGLLVVARLSLARRRRLADGGTETISRRLTRRETERAVRDSVLPPPARVAEALEDRRRFM